MKKRNGAVTFSKGNRGVKSSHKKSEDRRQKKKKKKKEQT